MIWSSQTSLPSQSFWQPTKLSRLRCTDDVWTRSGFQCINKGMGRSSRVYVTVPKRSRAMHSLIEKRRGLSPGSRLPPFFVNQVGPNHHQRIENYTTICSLPEACLRCWQGVQLPLKLKLNWSLDVTTGSVYIVPLWCYMMRQWKLKTLLYSM